MATIHEFRRLRPAPKPLGNFFRLGYNDHIGVGQALAEDRGTGTGLVTSECTRRRTCSASPLDESPALSRSTRPGADCAEARDPD